MLDDADLKQAVNIAVSGRFLHQAELCVSANRIIVEEKLHDRFVEAFVERVRALKYGDPNDPDTAIGPIISRRQLEGLERIVAQAKVDGAMMRVGAPAEGLNLGREADNERCAAAVGAAANVGLVTGVGDLSYTHCNWHVARVLEHRKKTRIL